MQSLIKYKNFLNEEAEQPQPTFDVAAANAISNLNTSELFIANRIRLTPIRLSSMIDDFGPGIRFYYQRFNTREIKIYRVRYNGNEDTDIYFFVFKLPNGNFNLTKSSEYRTPIRLTEKIISTNTSLPNLLNNITEYAMPKINRQNKIKVKEEKQKSLKQEEIKKDKERINELEHKLQLLKDNYEQKMGKQEILDVFATVFDEANGIFEIGEISFPHMVIIKIPFRPTKLKTKIGSFEKFDKKFNNLMSELSVASERLLDNGVTTYIKQEDNGISVAIRMIGLDRAAIEINKELTPLKEKILGKKVLK